MFEGRYILVTGGAGFNGSHLIESLVSLGAREACNGILFNHESQHRGENFVTRKITLAAARIARVLEDKLYLAMTRLGETGAMHPIMSRPCG